MVVNLSFILFIGIIAIGITTSKKIESDYDVIEVSDLQRLLKIFQNGNVRNRHENQERKHHIKEEGNHNLMNIQSLNAVVKHNNLRPEKLVEKNDKIKKDGNRVHNILCAITGSYGCSKNDNLDHIEPPYDTRYLAGLDLINESKEKLTHRTDEKEDSDDPKHKIFEKEAQNDLELLLNDLEKKIIVQEDKELRCRGNRCGRQGDGGVRSTGDGRESRDGDGNKREHDMHPNLRCKNKRCKRGRAGNDNDDDDTRDGNGTNELRCEGNQCVGDINDDYYDNDSKDYSGKDELRCIGNQCGTSRNHIAGADSDFKSVLYNYGKRYKINNELDAIVLDVDKLENGFQTLNTSENIMPKENKSILRNKKYRKLRHKKRQYLNLLNQPSVNRNLIIPRYQTYTISEFADYMQEKVLEIPVNLSLNFIVDRNSHEYKYFSNNPGIFTGDDQDYLKRRKRWYQIFETPPDSGSLPKYKKYITDYFKAKQIKVIPGTDNDQIVIPEWMFLGVEDYYQSVHPNLQNRPYLRKKSLLPLTMKQKMRLVNSEKVKTLVPFVLDVKGLGQVNS